MIAAGLLGWLLAALFAGCVLGRAIRTADRHETAG